MRQRKVKNLETRIDEVRRYFIEDAAACRGRWDQVFGNDHAIFLEIGCGKGNFILARARARPERNFVAIEGQLSVVFRALQKLAETELANARFACAFVNRPAELFAEGELTGIYLNFSDPWAKKRHARRRLTHRDYLRQYHEILKPGGSLEIKTDDDALFAFTENEVREAASGLFQTAARADDLHRSDFDAKAVTSEYEEKFRAAGKTIKYLRLVRR